MVNIVTITSDFGWKDYYLAVIKGAILSKNPQTTIVDVTHDIDNYDIVQAAFIVKNTWPSFPPKTIHLVSVNDFGHHKEQFLAIKANEQYFIGPDNGVFSLIFQDTPPETYLLEYLPSLNYTFPLKEIYSNAVAHILSGRPFGEIGKPAHQIVKRLSFQPVIMPSRIQGTIIHIDGFENAIVNIHKDLFEQVGHGRQFSIHFKRHDPILKLSSKYADVPIGETLGFFNSSGHLEIAINMGKAASLLDLKLEDTVQIDFH